MRPLFDKNDVQIDFPYQIEHETREKPMLACPRCGHVQPRKKNVVCASCNHMVPTDNCRQSWHNLPKNEYKEMAKAYFSDPDKPNKEFRKAKGSYGWQQRTRSIVITFVIAVLLVIPSIFAMKAYMGDAAWSNLEHHVEEMVQKISNTNLQPAPAAATAESAKVAEAAPAAKSAPAKHSKAAKSSKSKKKN
ncbi:MAG: hypothetical protein K2Z81_27755 [Cyanobacteria bacterium]|nr:hypothetical protein [Cyanobacteriota bacterium]